MRGLLIFLGKCVVSAALIGLLLSRLSFDEIGAAMGDPHWGWLVAAFAVYGLSAFGGALQWQWILGAAGLRTPAREIQRLYFIGLFFNNFLPANVGGDAWKIVDLGRQEHRPLAVFCSTLLDRMIGLAALAGLAVVMLVVAGSSAIPLPTVALVMVPVFLFLVAALFLLISRRIGARLVALLRSLHLGRLADPLERIVGEFGAFRSRVRWLNAVFAFSLLIQGLRMATHLLIARGLGFEIGAEQVVQLLVLVPVLAVSLTLPVTVNGIGLREQVSERLLVWAGLGVPQAVAMELGAFLVQGLFSLQGGVLLWLGRWRRSGSQAGN